MARISSDTSLSSEISNAVVKITRSHTGRGSPRTRTYVVDDLIVCVQKDALTPLERSFRDAGRSEQARQLRSALREGLGSDFVPMIEGLTGRRVISFLSDYDVERDVGVDCFVLGPDQEAGEDRDPSGPTVVDRNPP